MHKYSMLTHSWLTSKIGNQDDLCTCSLLIKEILYFLGCIGWAYKYIFDCRISFYSSNTLQRSRKYIAHNTTMCKL
jgi:hypothetical protein